jgi:8-oxo-dGTP pyrophosphatase MutT (NUDIX family)
MSSVRRRRRTARLLLVDSDERILLMRGGDPQRPAAGTWWFTPGGGIESDESAEQAARRELWEETGLRRDALGEPVFERELVHEFDGVVYDQSEVYFLVRTEPFDIDTSRWTEVERSTVVEHRWWSRDDLAATTDLVYPDGLVDRLDRLLD